jgi:hypothetical protein
MTAGQLVSRYRIDWKQAEFELRVARQKRGQRK